jgi:hypothetical protein
VARRTTSYADPVDAQLLTSVSASSLAELMWLRPSGEVGGVGVTACVHDDRPVVAFTYAAAGLAREIAAAPRVVLTLTEHRSTSTAFVPLAASGRPTLYEDPEGDLYVDALLLQELRRYPPARRYADSPLLRREHWWYLPRLVLGLDVDEVSSIAARASAEDHLLAVATGPAEITVRTARVRATGPADVDVVPDAPVVEGAAVLFGHDASFPDLERWTQWRWVGRWDGQRLEVVQAPERTGLGPVPGILQRLRAERDLARRCRRGLAGR